MHPPLHVIISTLAQVTQVSGTLREVWLIFKNRKWGHEKFTHTHIPTYIFGYFTTANDIPEISNLHTNCQSWTRNIFALVYFLCIYREACMRLDVAVCKSSLANIRMHYSEHLRLSLAFNINFMHWLLFSLTPLRFGIEVFTGIPLTRFINNYIKIHNFVCICVCAHICAFGPITGNPSALVLRKTGTAHMQLQLTTEKVAATLFHYPISWSHNKTTKKSITSAGLKL